MQWTELKKILKCFLHRAFHFTIINFSEQINTDVATNVWPMWDKVSMDLGKMTKHVLRFMPRPPQANKSASGTESDLALPPPALISPRLGPEKPPTIIILDYSRILIFKDYQNTIYTILTLRFLQYFFIKSTILLSFNSKH